jgi:hypothetical protein
MTPSEARRWPRALGHVAAYFGVSAKRLMRAGQIG